MKLSTTLRLRRPTSFPIRSELPNSSSPWSSVTGRPSSEATWKASVVLPVPAGPAKWTGKPTPRYVRARFVIELVAWYGNEKVAAAHRPQVGCGHCGRCGRRARLANVHRHLYNLLLTNLFSPLAWVNRAGIPPWPGRSIQLSRCMGAGPNLLCTYTPSRLYCPSLNAASFRGIKFPSGHAVGAGSFCGPCRAYSEPDGRSSKGVDSCLVKPLVSLTPVARGTGEVIGNNRGRLLH